MAQTVLGIDIGSNSVSFCKLTRSLRDFEVIHFSEHVLKIGPKFTYDEAVSQALKNYLETHPVEDDIIISVSFPAHQLSNRIITLPFTNLKKIEQTLEFELESYIPVNLDELIVDYHVLETKDNQSTVLVSYVPRVRFAKFLDLLEQAGLDPRYIGVDCVDLSNIVQVSMVPQQAVYAILDIGHKKTNLCVMKGLKLQYTRSLTIGGYHFTRAIQKSFRLSFEKAEGLKLDRGRVTMSQESPDQISRICQKVAEELIMSIKQSYLGYRKVYPDHEWSSIFITGGASRMSGLVDILTSSFKMNVDRLECLDYVNHHLSQPDRFKDIIAPSFAQTLRVIFSNKAPKINFRRGEFAFKRDFKSVGPEIKQLGLWLILVVVLGLTHFFFAYSSINSQIEKMDKDLVKKAVQVLPELKNQKVSSVSQLLKVIGSRTQDIKTRLEEVLAGNQEATALKLLDEISKKMPPKSEVQVDIDDFIFGGDNIRLEGRTISFEAVDKIKNALSKSEIFTNVETRNVVKGIRNQIKFSLSLDIANAESGEES